ncbi:MAG: hypothetical protein HY744_04850 [Deltaproteobacteria bacterium]|nr:hypothetical protein [Deltaproteobacteria bacterium]
MVQTELCARAADVHHLAPPPANVGSLARALSGRPGVHVWILDDLSRVSGLEGRPAVLKRENWSQAAPPELDET